MREWIRILSLSETKKSFENKKNSYNYFRKSKNFIFSLKNFKYFVKKIINTVTKKSGDYDFSNEVYESMKGCLICKACVSHCPVHVNVPEFRSKFIYLYHTRYLRPLKDYIVGSIETTGHFFSKMPFFINYLISSSLINSFLKNQIGLRDLPKFSPEKFKKIHFSKEKQDSDLEKLISQPTEKMDRSLILLQDAFTSFYESQILSEFYALLCKLDFNVFVAPFHPNGKPLHVKGFLNQFRDVAEKNTKWLTRLASCGVPLVGLEPSVVLTYRDEYLQILGQEQLPFEVFLPQEFLINKREKLRNYKISTKINDYQLLGHCTEMSNSQESQDQWRDLFNLFGLSLRIIEVGCCGMAGTFGHETEHYEESLGIYNLSWKDKMPADSFLKQNILTTGFSCRSQVMRIEGFRPLHPLQALLREIKFTN